MAHTERVARSTIVVMGGLAASLVTGLVRLRVIAGAFGTSSALDAYGAANGIPELLFNALAGGALSFAFIPIYTGLIGKDEEQGNALFSRVVNSIFLLTALASIIAAVLAPVLVTAPWGVGANFPAATQRVTIALMRILLISTLIFAVSSILTGTLYAHQHFLLPAITAVMYGSGIIFGALFLSPTLGIYGVAWGAVIGAVLHLLVQVPGVIKYGVRWNLTLGWGDPTLRKVAVLMLPRIFDLVMARISIDWFKANLASGLGEGRVAALDYAAQLSRMPWTLIGTAIGIAVFPTMAALAAQTDYKAQRSVLSGAVRAILTLALPAGVGLLVLGRPLIRVLYEGGEFTAQSTELVYFALQFYVAVFISQSMLEIVVRAFAARQDTLTPVIVSVFTTLLNLGLALWLRRPISEGGLEHGGIALANGIAVGVEALTGLVILHLRWQAVDWRRILLDAIRAGIAALVMGGSIRAIQTVFELSSLMTLVVGGLAGVLVYAGSALLLGIQEVRTLPLAMIKGLRPASTPAE